MFQFSLFSSFIPYLTIAVMYVLYLGVYTYNKLNAEHEQVAADEATENTISWESNPAQETLHISNNQFFADDCAEEISSQQLAAPLHETCRKLHEPNGDILISANCWFQLFSRPPPHIS